jgi:predicted transcriptional regulator
MLSVEQIAHALQKKAGNVTETAKALGVTRGALYKRIVDDEELQQVLRDARETLVDVAEAQLLKQVKQGNTAAIIFTLKTQGKGRGYVERQEITGADGGPLRFSADDAAQAQKELDEWRKQKSNGSSAPRA